MEAKSDMVPVWLDSQRNPRSTQSKWLHSTLSDLDDKAKMMLDLIEADGDSFAQRADMYYRNRPELIQMVQTLHKSYEALAYKYEHLAEKYDQLKSEPSVKVSNNGSEPTPSTSVEKQQPLLENTPEQKTKPSPSLKAIHCDDKTIDFCLASSSESNGSSFEYLSPLNLPSTNAVTDECLSPLNLPSTNAVNELTDEKDVVDMNDIRAQKESKIRERQDERFSKLLEEKLSKRLEPKRRTDEKREMVKNENELKRSPAGDKAKGSNSDSKTKFKRFFCLQKANLANIL